MTQPLSDRGFNSFAFNMIKLSVNETQWRSLLARTPALILCISIGIFDFGPEKLPGLSKNGPQGALITTFCTLNVPIVYVPTQCLSIALPEEDWRDIRCILNEEE